MTSTGLDSFDTTVQETNKILNDIMGEFNWYGQKDWAYDALRAVLQTLRDRLQVNEAADLGSQLPMLVRGFYYEGWKPANTPQDWNRKEFLNKVKQRFSQETNKSPEDLVIGVMVALDKNISRGEWQDIISNLPEDLKPLFSLK